MWETSALVELLERKGFLTRQEVLAMIQELRQREPTGRPAATQIRDVRVRVKGRVQAPPWPNQRPLSQA